MSNGPQIPWQGGGGNRLTASRTRGLPQSVRPHSAQVRKDDPTGWGRSGKRLRKIEELVESSGWTWGREGRNPTLKSLSIHCAPSSKPDRRPRGDTEPLCQSASSETQVSTIHTKIITPMVCARGQKSRTINYIRVATQ